MLHLVNGIVVTGKYAFLGSVTINVTGSDSELSVAANTLQFIAFGGTSLQNATLIDTDSDDVCLLLDLFY